VKYFVQKLSEGLNRNYLCMLHLYSVLHREKCLRKFHGGIMTVHCCVKQQFTVLTKLHSVGSVLYDNFEKDLLTEEKFDNIGSWLEVSPKKLLHLLPLQCGLAEYTAHIGVKFPKLGPYKTTVVHSFLPPDCEVTIQYCTWFQESVFKGLFVLELTFYSDRPGTL
jgi:hypothetical protein